MTILIGILFIIVGAAALLLARPRGGKPRWFVNTNFEVPAVLLILGTIAVGMVLSAMGVVELRQ
jgi:hypothetical protein